MFRIVIKVIFSELLHRGAAVLKSHNTVITTN